MTRNGARGFSDQNNHFVKVPEVPKSAGYHRKAMLVLKGVCKEGAGCNDAELHVHPSALASGQGLI